MIRRRTKSTTDFRPVSLLLFLLFLIFFTTDVYWQYYAQRFAKEGIAVFGQVEEKYIFKSGRGIIYVYEDSRGFKYREDEPYNCTGWNDLVPGSKIPIMYLKSAPEFSVTTLRLHNLSQPYGWKWLLFMLPLIVAAICHAHYWLIVRKQKI